MDYHDGPETAAAVDHRAMTPVRPVVAAEAKASDPLNDFNFVGRQGVIGQEEDPQARRPVEWQAAAPYGSGSSAADRPWP